MLKTAVIGVGGIGQHHARIYDKISDLVAVCDINKRRLDEIANRYKVNKYTDFKEMLKKEHPEAVSVAVPTALHKKVGMYVLKRTNALVEKPVTTNVGAFNLLLETSQKNSTIFMPGLVERFNPLIHHLKSEISSNVFYLSFMRLGTYAPRSPGCSVIVDLGIHDIDLLRYLTGENNFRMNVRAGKVHHEEYFDQAVISMFNPNVRATVVCNWSSPIKIRIIQAILPDKFIKINLVSNEMWVYSKQTYSISVEEGVEPRSIGGAQLSVYCAEKTLADCFKFRNKIGMDVVLEALKLYRERCTFDTSRLMHYARICRVESVMKPYLEAGL